MKIASILTALTLVASSAFAGEIFKETYGLSVGSSTLTISSNDGMIHICGEPMFPAGTFKYTIANNVLNLRADDSSAGIDFDYVSGKMNDVYGSWQAVDDGLIVTLNMSASSVEVVSDCE